MAPGLSDAVCHVQCSCGSTNVQGIPETEDGCIYQCGDCGTMW